MPWIIDPSGLCHWHNTESVFPHVLRGIEDALATKPVLPCWFWWNETPAPIAWGDTADTLYARWEGWRAAYQTQADYGRDFLQIILEYASCLERPSEPPPEQPSFVKRRLRTLS